MSAARCKLATPMPRKTPTPRPSDTLRLKSLLTLSFPALPAVRPRRSAMVTAYVRATLEATINGTEPSMYASSFPSTRPYDAEAGRFQYSKTLLATHVASAPVMTSASLIPSNRPSNLFVASPPAQAQMKTAPKNKLATSTVQPKSVSVKVAALVSHRPTENDAMKTTTMHHATVPATSAFESLLPGAGGAALSNSCSCAKCRTGSGLARSHKRRRNQTAANAQPGSVNSLTSSKPTLKLTRLSPAAKTGPMPMPKNWTLLRVAIEDARTLVPEHMLIACTAKPPPVAPYMTDFNTGPATKSHRL
mmetsp:Transcript_70520/g.181749  ORF Transcript_70520/g.181749 Transcript_70520/m.181749 type:complete len:305 (+) Transcript_70520:531-1445(+)